MSNVLTKIVPFSWIYSEKPPICGLNKNPRMGTCYKCDPNCNQKVVSRLFMRTEIKGTKSSSVKRFKGCSISIIDESAKWVGIIK